MKKQNRKGFTIVELVIVIALIAILAAVLIPTFSNVINNAHESNDIVMVKNLNTVLNAEEINGNKATTMQDAIDQAREGGYNVDKLTPTSTGDIVWDQASNRFVLVNAKGEVVYKDETVTEVDLANGAYKLWKITKNVAAENKGYSLYLDDNYTGSDLNNLAVSTGLDVGNHIDVTKITYTGEAPAKTVEIYTNSDNTDLTINAPNDNVTHSGPVKNLNVIAVADASYHEKGSVSGKTTIEQGRFVVEGTAVLNEVVAKKTGAKAVKLEIKAGATVTGEIRGTDSSIIIEDGANLQQPVFAGGNSVVTNNSDKTTVLTDGSATVDGTASENVITEEVITTAEAFVTAFAKENAYIKLGADITFADLNEEANSYTLNLSETSYIYLDLNGHYLKDPTYDDFAYESGRGHIVLCTKGNLVISDTSNAKTGTVYATRSAVDTDIGIYTFELNALASSIVSIADATTDADYVAKLTEIQAANSANIAYAHLVSNFQKASELFKQELAADYDAAQSRNLSYAEGVQRFFVLDLGASAEVVSRASEFTKETAIQYVYEYYFYHDPAQILNNWQTAYTFSDYYDSTYNVNAKDTETVIKGGTYITKSYNGGTALRLYSTNVTIEDCKVYATNFALHVGGENIVIHDGLFVSTANNNYKTNAFAYTVALFAKNATINNATVYGIQGALSMGSENGVINGGYFEASGAAVKKYYEATGYDMTSYQKTAMTVDTAETTLVGSTHYGMYISGEQQEVHCIVNDCTVKAARLYAAYIGNSSDGGLGKEARVIFNGGSYTGASAAVCVDNRDPEYGQGVAAFYGGTYNSDMSSLMNDSIGYQLVDNGNGTWTIVAK